MFEIKSNIIFLKNNLTTLLKEKNFPLVDKSICNHYGIINLDLVETSRLIISFNNQKLNLKLPICFTKFYAELVKLVADKEILIDKLKYDYFKQTLSLNDKSISLGNTHNIIILHSLLHKKNGIEKLNLYKTIWPRDFEVQINKLDTHLTNLRNLLKKEFNFDFIFNSHKGLIFFN